MPKHSAIPAFIGLFAFLLAFGMVWRIWWLAGLSLLAIIGLNIARSFIRDIDYVVPAAEVERMETERLRQQEEYERRHPAAAKDDKAQDADQPAY